MIPAWTRATQSEFSTGHKLSLTNLEHTCYSSVAQLKHGGHGHPKVHVRKAWHGVSVDDNQAINPCRSYEICAKTCENGRLLTPGKLGCLPVDQLLASFALLIIHRNAPTNEVRHPRVYHRFSFRSAHLHGGPRLVNRLAVFAKCIH